MRICMLHKKSKQILFIVLVCAAAATAVSFFVFHHGKKVKRNPAPTQFYQDKWTATGREFTTENPGQHVFKTASGQQNVDLGNGSFAPYVWDQEKNTVRFADYRAQFNDKGVEFSYDGPPNGETSNQLFSPIFYPEIKRGDQWYRGSFKISNLQTEEVQTTNASDLLKVSYDIETTYQKTTVTAQFGGSNKAKFSFKIKALEAGEQRLTFEKNKDGKIEEIKNSDKSGNSQDEIVGYRFDGVSWIWNPDEIADHVIEDQGSKIIIHLEQGEYQAGEEKILSPDVWGGYGDTKSIAANSDDAGWAGAINGCSSNRLYVDDSGSVDCQGGGLRFTGINLGGSPAYIDDGTRLTMLDSVDNSGSNGLVRFKAENAQDPATYGAGAGQAPKDRTYTTDYDDTVFDSIYGHTPSIKNSIQELIDDGYSYDGTAGHSVIALGFGGNQAFSTGQAVSYRDVTYDYNSGSNYAQLTIVYSDTLPIPLYRSVGTNSGDLNINTRNVTVAGSTATFSGTMPDNIGVGDVLQYDVSGTYYVAFISGRTSSTVYAVKNSAGGAPQATGGAVSVGVYRAYTSLHNWNDQDENGSLDGTVKNFDTSKDLVSVDSTMNVACYGDGPDKTALEIDGWTTDPTRTIRIYTPNSASEVGASQRHNGKWSDSAYQLSVSDTTVLFIFDDYVELDGLQLSSNQDWNGQTYAIYIRNQSNASVETRIHNNIIRGVSAGTQTEFVGIATISDGIQLVYNNIIYGFDDPTGTSYSAGIFAVSGDAYYYNNTIYDCEYGIDGGNKYNTDVWAKNNLIQDCTTDYTQTHAEVWEASSTNNLSSDATAPGSNAKTNKTVAFADKAGADFHLASYDTEAKYQGTDLTIDPQGKLSFSTDIDGDTRLVWDIGADESSLAIAIYRSVGITATNLNTDNRDVTITDSTATFSDAMPNNVGVGDVLQYQVDGTYYVAFIYGRTSSTVYTVKDSAGAAPQATGGEISVGVYRAYTSLYNWNDQNENDTLENTVENFDTSRDLAGNSTTMNVACYADGTDVSSYFDMSSWTTDTDNYIKIYTPTDSNEVGTSQRHNGTWGGGGYRISAENTYVLAVGVDHVKIFGLQIISTGTWNSRAGIAATDRADCDFAYNMITLTGSGVTDGGHGIITTSTAFRSVRVYNNIVFNTLGEGLDFSSGVDDGAVAYNNTIYGTGGAGMASWSGGKVLARNNLITNCTGNNYDATFSTGSDYNASDDATSSGGDHDLTSQAFDFVDAAGDDFHITSYDTAARENGVSLFGDYYIQFSDDIDGNGRPYSNYWDMGADEAQSVTPIYRSVGPSKITTLQDGDGNDLTISNSESTATFDTAVANIIGLGDVIQYDSDGNSSIDSLAFIAGRVSGTEFIVKKADGTAPTAVTDDEDWDIFRAYSSLQNAESGIENTGIESTLRNFDNWKAGGDATEDELGKNLVTADQQWNIVCYANEGTADSSVQFDGWTTDATHYLKVYTPVSSLEVGESQRHSGVWDDTKYKIEHTSKWSIPIDDNVNFMVFDGLQVKYTVSDGSYNSTVSIGGFADTSAASVTVANSILWGVFTGSASQYRGIGVGSGDQFPVYIYNNILYGFNTPDNTTKALYFGSGLNAYVYNNTVYDSDYGYYIDGVDSPVLRNNIAQNCDDGFYNGSRASGPDYNVSDIAGDAPNTNFAGGQATVTFARVETSDFHLGAGDAAAKDQGMDLSDDYFLSFSTDIDGDTRPFNSVWDIGADEYVSAAPPAGGVGIRIKGGVNIKGGVRVKANP